MLWIIKNNEGGLLKYLYAHKAVFTKPTDRAFRVYTFAKYVTVEKTLENLKEFGWENCEVLQLENEDALEQFNTVQQHKDTIITQNNINYDTALLNASEFTEDRHKYCRVCSRGCKLSVNTVFYGRCPQFDFNVIN